MMSTESVLPPFLDGGDPAFRDPVLSQLFTDTSQDELLNDLLTDDLLSSLLDNDQQIVQTSPTASYQPLPEAMDPTLFPVHPSLLATDGYTSETSPVAQGSPSGSTSDQFGSDPLLAGQEWHIMEPFVSTTAPSPTASSSTSSDVRIDVDLDSPTTSEGKSDLKASSLVLTEEEKKLLTEEGVHLPTDMPLTKAEQKQLKRVRRKIKNKISAQESRKRKKEYVDGLEQRVEKCTMMNRKLQDKVQVLESENQSLLSQLRKFQAMVAKYHPSRLQGGAMVMVLALSFSLFFMPRFGPNSPPTYQTVTVHSRSLLFTETDDFGNIIDPESGKVISEVGGQSPVLPPPWINQSPAFELTNLSFSKQLRTSH